MQIQPSKKMKQAAETIPKKVWDQTLGNKVGVSFDSEAGKNSMNAV
jgi:hypothetical protein